MSAGLELGGTGVARGDLSRRPNFGFERAQASEAVANHANPQGALDALSRAELHG